MFNWLSDILDSAIQVMESKGVKIIIPILGVNFYLSTIFINIQSFASAAELIKNLIISCIGIAGGLIGVINAYLSLRKRIKKDKEENKAKKRA